MKVGTHVWVFRFDHYLAHSSSDLVVLNGDAPAGDTIYIGDNNFVIYIINIEDSFQSFSGMTGFFLRSFPLPFLTVCIKIDLSYPLIFLSQCSFSIFTFRGNWISHLLPWVFSKSKIRSTRNIVQMTYIYDWPRNYRCIQPNHLHEIYYACFSKYQCKTSKSGD